MSQRRQAGSYQGKLPLATLMARLQSPELATSIDALYQRYGRYAMPDEELRKLVSKEMGDKTLTGELYAMREGR